MKLGRFSAVVLVSALCAGCVVRTRSRSPRIGDVGQNVDVGEDGKVKVVTERKTIWIWDK